MCTTVSIYTCNDVMKCWLRASRAGKHAPISPSMKFQGINNGIYTMLTRVKLRVIIIILLCAYSGHYTECMIVDSAKNSCRADFLLLQYNYFSIVLKVYHTGAQLKVLCISIYSQRVIERNMCFMASCAMIRLC